MTKLTYTAIASLDGFIEDEHGNFDWAFPGPDVHAFVNQLERPVGLYLYGGACAGRPSPRGSSTSCGSCWRP
jgi:hypothetical protein